MHIMITSSPADSRSMTAQPRARQVACGRLLFLAGLALALSACSSLPSTSPLAHVALPSAWKNVPSATASTPDTRPQAWWRDVNDPALEGWIELALVRNRELARSALRLRQASLQARRADSDAWPKASSSLNTSAQQSLQNTQGTATTLVNGVSVPVESSVSSKLTTSANAGLSASYEADLWGRIAQTRTLAQQDHALAQTDLQTARWLLTTQVAEQYWTLAAIDAKVAPMAQARQDAQASLEATRLKLSVGKSRPGEEDKAIAALREAQRNQLALTTQRETAQQTMALLLDEPPQTFMVAQASLPPKNPPEPGSWVVASVLDRLPAVQRARIAVDQALTKLNIAQSNRYPQLSLSAGLSSSGNQLRNTLSNPFSSLGLNLTLPMLDWTRLGLERDSAQLGLEIAALDFREALFKALAEVETQYNNRQQWQADAQWLQEKVQQGDRALAVAQLRYEQGAEPLQTVRDAQARLRELQMSAIDTRFKAWINQVTIFKAWGGPLAEPSEIFVIRKQIIDNQK